MPFSRCIALLGATATLTPAVYAQAWLTGDLDRLSAYEEDWGAKDVRSVAGAEDDDAAEWRYFS